MEVVKKNILLKQIFKSEFLRNTAMLFTGSTLAQAISILTAPIVLRIYAPEDYGVLGLFISITAILGAFATLQYHHAVITSPDTNESQRILFLIVLFCLAIGGVSLLAILFFHNQILNFFDSKELGPWLMLVPFHIFFSGLSVALSCFAVRQKEFKMLSVNRVVAALLIPVLSITLGLLVNGPFGLIVGIFFSQLLSCSLLLFSLRKRGYLPIRSSWEELKGLAKKYSRFPRYSLASEFINGFGNQLPLIALNFISTPREVGFFNLSNRMMGLPSQVVSDATGEVFRQRAARDFNESGNCRPILMKTSLMLLAIAVPAFSIIIFFGADIFAFFFGNQWREAGVYAQILSGMFLLRFVVSPMSYVLIIANRQKLDFVLHIIVLLGVWGVYKAAAVYHQPPYAFLAAFAIFYSLIYITYFIFCWKYAKR
jgi:O-antigen/teichoic acid export membrane protein